MEHNFALNWGNLHSEHPQLTRRALFGAALAAATARGADFEIVDFHAHVEDPPEIDAAIAQAKAAGVKLGILWHAGKPEYNYAHMLSCDADMERFLKLLEGKPVYRGIQAEGPDWMECFSKRVIAKLDYVLTDALTFRERDKRMVKLWLAGVQVGDPQDFMDRYVDWHIEIMATEPIDIIANPTFLPNAIIADYDRLWTERRVRAIIDAAVKYRVAIEINSRYNIPKLSMLRMARDAGVKFTFGSNAHGLATGKLAYSLDAAKQLGLEAKHMFRPAPAGRKPIERRRV
jgi:hypothetical protein